MNSYLIYELDTLEGCILQNLLSHPDNVIELTSDIVDKLPNDSIIKYLVYIPYILEPFSILLNDLGKQCHIVWDVIDDTYTLSIPIGE